MKVGVGEKRMFRISCNSERSIFLWNSSDVLKRFETYII